MKTLLSELLMIFFFVIIALNIQAYYFTQKLKSQELYLTNQIEICKDNYRMLQEKKYVPKEIGIDYTVKRSMKYKTMKWRG